MSELTEKSRIEKARTPMRRRIRAERTVPKALLIADGVPWGGLSRVAIFFYAENVSSPALERERRLWRRRTKTREGFSKQSHSQELDMFSFAVTSKLLARLRGFYTCQLLIRCIHLLELSPYLTLQTGTKLEFDSNRFSLESTILRSVYDNCDLYDLTMVI